MYRGGGGLLTSPTWILPSLSVSVPRPVLLPSAIGPTHLVEGAQFVERDAYGREGGGLLTSPT